MNDEINRLVHQAMDAGCYHESDDTERATVTCKHCGNGFGGGAWERANPDYTTDLNAVTKAEAFAIEKAGRSEYYGCLEYQVGIEDLFAKYWVVTATAEQRAKAVLSALNINTGEIGD
jgi:hypothetical protein